MSKEKSEASPEMKKVCRSVINNGKGCNLKKVWTVFKILNFNINESAKDVMGGRLEYEVDEKMEAKLQDLIRELTLTELWCMRHMLIIWRLMVRGRLYCVNCFVFVLTGHWPKKD